MTEEEIKDIVRKYLIDKLNVDMAIWGDTVELNVSFDGEAICQTGAELPRNEPGY
jgi:hypothetical protein